MTPSEWYGGRTGHWASALDRDERIATRLSRLRLATFGAGAVLVGWAWHEAGHRSADLLFMAGVAAFVVFGVFVRHHARVLDRIACAEAGLRLAAIGTARIARDWHALPDLAPPPELDVDRHPYARDIDIFGRASLTKWIGRTATADGQRTLWGWLLNPADREDVLARQPAIDELAGRRDWRETLAIEGELTSLRSAELVRFLAWAEDGRSAVPAFMRAAAVALPLATAALLILFLTGAVQGAWWAWRGRSRSCCWSCSAGGYTPRSIASRSASARPSATGGCSLSCVARRGPLRCSPGSMPP